MFPFKSYCYFDLLHVVARISIVITIIVISHARLLEFSTFPTTILRKWKQSRRDVNTLSLHWSPNSSFHAFFFSLYLSLFLLRRKLILRPKAEFHDVLSVHSTRRFSFNEMQSISCHRAAPRELDFLYTFSECAAFAAALLKRMPVRQE